MNPSHKFNLFIATLFLAFAAIPCYYSFALEVRLTGNSILFWAFLGIGTAFEYEMSIWNRARLCFFIVALATLGMEGR